MKCAGIGDKLLFKLGGLRAGAHLVCVEHPNKTEGGIQFVRRAVGLYPETILPDLLPSGEAGSSGISGPCVNFGDSHEVFSRYAELAYPTVRNE